MMPNRFLLLGGCAILFMASGCTLSFEVPDGAIIECDGNDDCPSGTVCATEARRCVAADNPDRDPPTIEIAVSVDGAARAEAAEGARVELVLTSDEALITPFSVALLFSDGSRRVAPFSERSGGATFEASFVVSDEPEGPVDIEFAVADIAGLVAADMVAGALVIDRTAPRVRSQGRDLVIWPPRISVAPSVEHVTVGSGLALTFSVTEPLREPPSVSLGGQLFAVTIDDEGFAEAILDPVDPGVSEDEDAIDIRLVDLAGNTGSASLPVVVDVTDPDPVDTDTLGATTLVRIPFGDDGEGPRLYVEGEPGAAEPEGRVVVRTLDGEPLGQLPVASDGSFGGPESAFIIPDQGVVRIVVLDRAGNASTPAQVRDIELVATLRGRVFGSSFENPTRVLRSLGLNGALDTLGEELPSEDTQALSRPDGVGLTGARGDAWTRLVAPEGEPVVAGRNGHDMVHDSFRGRFVVLGWLQPNGGSIDELWEVDPTTRSWDALYALPVGPASIDRGALAYDVRSAVSLWLPSASSNLWAWDGTSWEVVDTTSGPTIPGRLFGRAVFDASRNKTIVFGGTVNGSCPPLSAQPFGEGCPSNDLWELSNRRWERRCDGEPASDVCPDQPGPRLWHAMVYDPIRGVTVLSGGEVTTPDPCPDGAVKVSGTCIYDDLWEWDGEVWTRVCNGSDCSTTPGPLTRHAAAFDSTRGGLVLGGGRSDAGAQRKETWFWDPALNTWSPLGDVTGFGFSEPEGFQQHAAAYDQRSQRVWMFGGTNSDDQTSRFAHSIGATGTEWTREEPAPDAVEPGPRDSFALAYDPVTQRHIGFATRRFENDSVCPGTEVCDYTWSLNPSTGAWATLNPTTVPFAKAAMGMATDPNTGRIVFFGGTARAPNNNAPCGDGSTSTSETPLCWYQQTWEWVSASENWQLRNTGNGTPARRENTAMTATGDRIVLFGGFRQVLENAACGDGTTAPSRQCYFDDQWEYGEWGTTTCGGAVTRCWRQVLLANGPSRRTVAAMAWDADDDALVLFGGSAIPEVFGDTWIFRDGAWSQICAGDGSQCAEQPARREGARLVTDAQRGRVLLMGGRAGSMLGECPPGGVFDDAQFECFFNDVWSFDVATETWTRLSPNVGPNPRAQPALSYDPLRNLVVLTGGRRSSSFPTDDAWVFGDDATRPNGWVWEIPSRLLGSSAVESARVELTVQSNAEWGQALWAYRPALGRFVRIDEGIASATRVGTVTDPAVAADVLAGVRDSARFAVTSDPSAPDNPSVQVDYQVLRIAYRR